MSPRSFRSTRPGRRSVAKVVVNTLLALIAPADLKSQAGREREKEDALKIAKDLEATKTLLPKPTSP
jgi:hypothetical protein